MLVVVVTFREAILAVGGSANLRGAEVRALPMATSVRFRGAPTKYYPLSITILKVLNVYPLFTTGRHSP